MAYMIVNGVSEQLCGGIQSKARAFEIAQEKANRLDQVVYICGEDLESFPISPDDLVTIEEMPEYLRASHRAAGNWGVSAQWRDAPIRAS